MLGENVAARENVANIKSAVREALEEFKEGGLIVTGQSVVGKENAKTFASIVTSSPKPKVYLRGHEMEVSETTSFLVVPNEANMKKYKSSQETKDAVCRLLNPADYALRINKILLAKNNGVRIVSSPDIGKIKADPSLAKAGLKVLENVKFNPRLIVYGVPLGLSHAAISNEIAAQNFEREDNVDLKVVYIYPPKQNKTTTNCIIEVSPDVRKRLQVNKRIYIGYSSCGFADHIRIIQCYRCVSSGHIAAECDSEPLCGHCSGSHELRTCKNRRGAPKCANCVRDQGSVRDVAHSALDVKKCPALIRRMKNKLLNINYD